MDGWTVIVLPTLHLDKAQDRMEDIAYWAQKHSIKQNDCGISSRIVRFKNAVDATLFKLSFNGKENNHVSVR